MTQFRNLWNRASEKVVANEARPAANQKGVKFAGGQLSREQKKKAGPIVHYGFGTGMGTVYGTIMEIGPRDLRRHELVSGIGFGSLLFAGADEIAVPAAGLSSPPQEVSAAKHLYALTSHILPTA